MNTKRIVITGGPATGKTSLIKYLEDQGHKCLHEISREVTKRAQQQGIDQLFLTDPILFSKMLLEGRIAQFNEAKDFSSTILFYDRGLPDVTAYMDYLGTVYGDEFTIACKEHNYDTIFLLPPWRDIYQQDNERYESYEQAEEIFKFLKEGYQSYGYQPIIVPVGSIAYRANYMLDKIKTLF